MKSKTHRSPMRRYTTALLLLGGLFLISPLASAQLATCTGSEEYYVQWPKDGVPVWEMCFVTPENSSAADGSGLELREVYFGGYQVFERAHSPMLFADYSSSTCYRDWKDVLSNFLADNETIGGVMAEPTMPVETTCDLSQDPDIPVFNCPYATGRPGSDCFEGVAVQWEANQLILSTQYSAAWYKYESRAFFFDDGSIEFLFGFGNSDGTGSGTTHWHHNYWRLDFDIDGTSDNDQVFLNDTLQSTEFSDLRDATGGPMGGPVTWSVIDQASGRGYRLEPSANDYNLIHNESGSNYHEVDLMATQYHPGEFADNPDNFLSDCEMDETALVNGESLAGEDIVLYYMAGVKDTAGVDMMICKKAGPRLVPIGDWGPVTDVIFDSGSFE
ncbi:MAG: hypothetical protein DHS20C11_14100 [Lysobacteraceae bacterium]|nr:MAG: hypothetical protein DHS20C11_14100 [Xanthomonadaceae bacterium]